MRYKLLGRTGLRVSELCLGTMTFGEEWGWGASKSESRRIFDAFAGTGGNFIDTANRYTDGTSEKYVGEFIASDRQRYVLATKYTLNVKPDDPNAGGNHRKNMVQSLEASLKRLGTDYIDLYWVHAWDFMTPADEVMRGLDDLVRNGKILYVGISDTPAWIVSYSNAIADLKGWSPFVGLQIKYSLVDRTPERDLLPMARALDIAVTPWGTLGSGALTGKFNRGADKGAAKGTRIANTPGGEDALSERNLSIAEEVTAVAGELGRSPSQVALNWVRQQHGGGVLIPIIGARTLAQVDDNLGCLEFEIPTELVRRLDDASQIDLGFPHDFLAQDGVRQHVHGQTLPMLDNHRERGQI